MAATGEASEKGMEMERWRDGVGVGDGHGRRLPNSWTIGHNNDVLDGVHFTLLPWIEWQLMQNGEHTSGGQGKEEEKGGEEEEKEDEDKRVLTI